MPTPSPTALQGSFEINPDTPILSVAAAVEKTGSANLSIRTDASSPWFDVTVSQIMRTGEEWKATINGLFAAYIEVDNETGGVSLNIHAAVQA